jgi:hypothetical protein
MDAAQAKELLDKIVGQVFGFQNPFTLEQFQSKYAFDIRLPQQVYDSNTNEPTWAQSTNPTKFTTLKNAWEKAGEGSGWMRPKKPLNNIQDVLAAWNEVNFTATEREMDSLNVGESDNTYFSENVYRSLDVHNSKNVLLSDAAIQCEFVAAVQRSQTSTYCIRLEDSQRCANSFSVSWSDSVTNSFFMHDCKDVQDSMFCTHIGNVRFCIANMQYEEAEYRKIEAEVKRWILTS